MKKLKWFFGNDNPLWMWVMSAMMLYVSAWMMYLAWAYAFARGAYGVMAATICLFSLPFAWVSYVSAMQALYLHQLFNTEFRNRRDLDSLIRKKDSLERDLRKTDVRIAELRRDINDDA